MTKEERELVMHKLRGNHRFEDMESEINKQTGDTILTQKCKVCGFEKKIKADNIIVGSGMPWATSTTFGSTFGTYTSSGYWSGGAAGSAGYGGGGAGGAFPLRGGTVKIKGKVSSKGMYRTIKKQSKKGLFDNLKKLFKW